MPAVTITVKVEEASFVPVIRALRKTAGVVGVDFDLALDHKGKSLNGAPQRAPDKKQRGSLQEAILRMLFEAEGSLRQSVIAEAVAAAGFKYDSVVQGLYNFRANGIVERPEPAMYRLTAAARKRMADNLQQAGGTTTPMLPPPPRREKKKRAAHGNTGRRALPVFLKFMAKQSAPVAREAIRLALTAEGYADQTGDRQILGAILEGYIKELSGDHYELTAKGRKHADQLATSQE